MKQIIYPVLTALLIFTSSFLPQQSRYVTEVAYRNHLSQQPGADETTLKKLRKHGVTEDKTCKLEYFFYTDDTTKALALHRELTKLGYECAYVETDSIRNLWMITGNTIKIRMAPAIVNYWAKQMCTLGYRFDCDFDGWRTSDF